MFNSFYPVCLFLLSYKNISLCGCDFPYYFPNDQIFENRKLFNFNEAYVINVLLQLFFTMLPLRNLSIHEVNIEVRSF